MKKIISLLLVASLLVGCSLVLAACGAPEDGGAKIKVYLGNEVFDFDPTDYYADSNAEQLMSLLFEPLFRVNAKGKLEMAAAKDYEVDEEENKIIVTLRESYWSDDVRVKAADFVYAWGERLLNPNNPNPAAALLYDIENAAAVKSGTGTVSDVAIKATDIYELTITYRKGADVDTLLRNLASVATAPVRQDVVDAAPTYWSKSVNTWVFNGPFKIRTLDRSLCELSLERNIGYHQSPDTVNYVTKVIPDTLVGFVTASGEEMEVSYSDIEEKTAFYLADAPLSVRADKSGAATKADDTSVLAYVFNTENPLFAIKEVRQALSLAIDREAVVDLITFGKAADGFLPDLCGGSDDALISTSSDLQAAEALLSGVDLTGISKSFTLTVDGTEESIAVGELVADAWESLGFNVTVKAAEPIQTTIESLGINFYDSGIQTLVKEASYGNREFDVLAVDWQLYTTDPFVGLSAFSTSMSGLGVDFSTGERRRNISGWSSDDYDYLISSAFKSTGEDREELLREAERVLCEDCPVVPIVFNQSFSFVGSDLSGVTVDGFGNLVLTEVKQKDYKKYLED